MGAHLLRTQRSTKNTKGYLIDWQDCSPRRQGEPRSCALASPRSLVPEFQEFVESVFWFYATN
jgi:hypothetical protein